MSFSQGQCKGRKRTVTEFICLNVLECEGRCATCLVSYWLISGRVLVSGMSRVRREMVFLGLFVWTLFMLFVLSPGPRCWN